MHSEWLQTVYNDISGEELLKEIIQMEFVLIICQI